MMGDRLGESDVVTQVLEWQKSAIGSVPLLISAKQGRTNRGVARFSV